MQVLRYLSALVAVGFFVCGDADAATCSTPRVRKAWRMLTSDEKTVYTNAVTSSLKSNEFLEFTKIHVHHMSEMQAHGTCAFLIWHKRFLIAFENMLRAQSDESKCLTVPYWDSMTEYAQMVDGSCKYVYDCSSIVRELGGSPTASKSVTIGGTEVSGDCYNGFPDFCSDDRSTCGCLPRSDLKSAHIPSGSAYGGLIEIIASSGNFEDFSLSIQNGIHNEMHNIVGGFMATFSSPNDPLFFSWHGTIDMLLYVYHQCHMADNLTAEEMVNSVYAFSQDGECSYNPDAPAALLTGSLVQQSVSDGKTYNAEDNPIIGKYFKGVSSKVSDLLGFKTLGSHSYTYEIPDALKKYLLLKKELCPAFVDAAGVSPSAAPVSTTPSPSSKSPATSSPVPVSSAPISSKPTTSSPTSTTPAPSPTSTAPSSTKTSTPVSTPLDPVATAAPVTSSTNPVASAADVPVSSTSSPTISNDSAVSSSIPPSTSVNATPSPTTSPPSTLPSSTSPVSPSVPSTTTEIPSSKPSSVSKNPTSLSGSNVGQVNAGTANGTISLKTQCQVELSLITVNENDLSIQAPKYWQWVEKTKEKLDVVYPGNHSEVSKQLQYLECICFQNQFGIQNFTTQFIEDFKVKQTKPTCLKKVEEVQCGDKEMVINVDKFDASTVEIKAGITPAPPVGDAVVADNSVDTSSETVNTEAKSGAPKFVPFVFSSVIILLSFMLQN